MKHKIKHFKQKKMGQNNSVTQYQIIEKQEVEEKEKEKEDDVTYHNKKILSEDVCTISEKLGDVSRREKRNFVINYCFAINNGSITCKGFSDIGDKYYRCNFKYAYLKTEELTEYRYTLIVENMKILCKTLSFNFGGVNYSQQETLEALDDIRKNKNNGIAFYCDKSGSMKLVIWW